MNQISILNLKVPHISPPSLLQSFIEPIDEPGEILGQDIRYEKRFLSNDKLDRMLLLLDSPKPKVNGPKGGPTGRVRTPNVAEEIGHSRPNRIGQRLITKILEDFTPKQRRP